MNRTIAYACLAAMLSGCLAEAEPEELEFNQDITLNCDGDGIYWVQDQQVDYRPICDRAAELEATLAAADATLAQDTANMNAALEARLDALEAFRDVAESKHQGVSDWMDARSDWEATIRQDVDDLQTWSGTVDGRLDDVEGLAQDASDTAVVASGQASANVGAIQGLSEDLVATDATILTTNGSVSALDERVGDLEQVQYEPELFSPPVHTTSSCVATRGSDSSQFVYDLYLGDINDVLVYSLDLGAGPVSTVTSPAFATVACNGFFSDVPPAIVVDAFTGLRFVYSDVNEGTLTWLRLGVSVQ